MVRTNASKPHSRHWPARVSAAAAPAVRELTLRLPVFKAGQWVVHRNARHQVLNTHLRDCELYLYLVGDPTPVLASEVQPEFRTVTLRAIAKSRV